MASRIFFAEQADGSYLSPPGVYSTLAMVQRSLSTDRVGRHGRDLQRRRHLPFRDQSRRHQPPSPVDLQRTPHDAYRQPWSGHHLYLELHHPIAKEVDPNGETTTYDYKLDRAVPHQRDIDSWGTTQYKYSQVGSITLLTSVTDATYVTTNYSYNAEGMLVGTNVGGQDSVTLSYPANSPGEVVT